MKRILTLAALFAIAVAPAALATNGYFTHGTGTLNKSMGGAGVALPQEAIDSANNPAAAVFLEHGYSASIALFSPDRSYSVKGNPSGYPQTFGLTPGKVASNSKYFPMPSVAGNFRPSETSAIAFSLLAKGGMNTNYATSTFYGAGHTGVDLAQMFVNATYAKKIGTRQSVGITLVGVAQRFKAMGLEAFGQMSSDPTNLSGNGYDLSYGAGAQIGYLGYVTPEFSVGATWTPKISMSKFDKYEGLFADQGSFDIPGSVEAGFAWKATDAVTLAADYQRIHYSDVESVGNHLFPNMMQGPLGAEHASGFGWDDVNVVKLGVAWNTSPDTTLRFGVSKANNPIPSSEVLFNVLAPGVIEQHYTVGISRAMKSAPGRFNVSVMYAPTQKVTGANPMEAPGQQQIELEMNEWELEFGYNF
jgi:long-chain fatty acid transport protein